MSNFTSAESSIRNTVFGEYSGVPVFFENIPEKNKPAEFLKVSILFGGSERENVNDNSALFPSGAIMVQIFTRKNKGLKSAYDIADSLYTLLSNREEDEGHLFINDVGMIPAGDPTGQYHQVNVQARFIFSYQP